MFELTAHEIYVFVLCLIVFSLFTVLFSVMLGFLISLYLKLIKHGVLDEKLKTEYLKQKDKKHTGWGTFIDHFVSILLCLAVCVAFAFSFCLKLNEDRVSEKIPSFKVVRSESMATKHKKNTYLNGIDDQVQMFDLIELHSIPAEGDLQLYDVVMYEINGDLILHRIVKIEEPNETHPNERWFTFQGDAVRYPDSEHVTYDQMLGIYRGERLPSVGSFVMFMQSPAGYLCILLVLIAMIATPILERKLENAKEERLRIVAATHCFRRYRWAVFVRVVRNHSDKNWFYRLMGSAVLFWFGISTGNRMSD